MSPERWQQIEALFQTAIDLSPTERQSFLDERCNGDDDLRLEVEKLLEDSESAEHFIESPVWTDSSFLNSSAKKVISDSLDQELSPATRDDFTGTQVGSYRLEREIGRGGMGAVYLAERADGEFSQRVAIKLIKRGMDSDFIIRRFRHERQILASFEHPFIARLLDGGTTGDGVPYFVMEYIEGDTLYSFCDQKRLEVRDRLKLFQKICSALSYAHERQIVHRDIKPSNILINKFGTPKLLDFGIAKILDPNLIHESINPTASLMRMMTPDYASPEQVQGLDVTPSSDIYSLGMLLYELLTAHKPYNFTGRSLHEVSRVICEVMPEPPSKIIGTSDNLLQHYEGDEKQAAYARSVTPDHLRELLDGDLDNIVMKALCKEPGERYATVREFSEDISRHLSGRAVSAAPFAVKVAERVSAPSSANTKALAVLPFRFLNLGPAGDTDDQFLGLGLADALISRLSKVRSFVVRPTSSILPFGGEPADPIKAGGELNVDYILDGSIKKANDRLRVTVQLLNVRENAAVWATSIDESVSEIFALEDTLAQRLIEALLPHLTGSELAEYSKRGTDSAEAFEHYLRGRYHFNTFTEDGLAKAFVAFHSAIAADPGYAHPHAGIADYYNWLGIIGVLPPQECFQPAIAAASRAVELDEELSEAHASLGFSVHAGNYDWAKAEYHLSRAIELNPGNATAYVWYSIVLFTEARFVEGLEFARRSIDLDPLTPFNHHNIGWGLYYARRYSEAIAQYERVIRDFPDYHFGYYGISKIHRMVGETKLAIAENNKAMQLTEGSIFSLLADAECYAADGRLDVAREKIDELLLLSNQRFVSPYQLSLAYCYIAKAEQTIDPETGEAAPMSPAAAEACERAFECLRQAVEIKEGWLNWLGVEPAFDPLRSDPRFEQILGPIGYHGFFRRSFQRPGELPDLEEITDGDGPAPHRLHDLTTLVISPGNNTDGGIDVATREPQPLLNRWVLPAAVTLAAIAVVLVGVFLYRPAGISQPVQQLSTISFRDPSIVVLPFTTEGGTASELGVGLADALTHKLGNIKSLQVVSASSGRAMSASGAAEIGKALSVSFLIRGELNTSPERPSLTAQMINTADENVLWAETFTAEGPNLFEVQAKLAEKIYSSLGVTLLPLELKQINRSYTENAEAYQLYLVGRYQMANRNAESLRRAIEAFSRSLELDSSFALADVGMADAYALLNLYDIEPPTDAYPKAERYAIRALAIDDDLAEAHASLAYVKFYFNRDRRGAELEFRRAIQLNPSYAQAHHWFALMRASMNRPLDALGEAQIAQRLDPLSPSIKAATAIVHFMAGNYSSALEECDKALAIDPRFVPALKVQRWTFTAMKDYGAAAESFRREREYSGGKSTDPGWQIIEAQVTAQGDDLAAKRAMLDAAVEHPSVKGNDFAFAFEIALAYHALSAPQKALDWLERAEKAGSHGFNFLESDPRIFDLRTDPRFSRLAKSLNP